MAVSENSAKSNKKQTAVKAEAVMQSAARGQIYDDLTFLEKTLQAQSARLGNYYATKSVTSNVAIIDLIRSEVEVATDEVCEATTTNQLMRAWFDNGNTEVGFELVEVLKGLAIIPTINSVLSKRGQQAVTLYPNLVYEALAERFSKAVSANEANHIVEQLETVIYNAIGEIIPMPDQPDAHVHSFR